MQSAAQEFKGFLKSTEGREFLSLLKKTRQEIILGHLGARVILLTHKGLLIPTRSRGRRRLGKNQYRTAAQAFHNGRFLRVKNQEKADLNQGIIAYLRESQKNLELMLKIITNTHP